MHQHDEQLVTPAEVVLFAAAGILGVSLIAAQPGRRRLERRIAALAGLGLIGFALHKPLTHSVRAAGTRRRSSYLRFSFTVDRPVEQVFAFCADFENFPRFIGALNEVRDSGDGRSHWCAKTPTGGTLEWDAVTTKFVTNSVIGWKNVAGAPVETKGVLRFTPEGHGTCVRVAIDYCVLDGRLTDAIAALVTRRRSRSLEAAFRTFESKIPSTTAERVAAEIPVVVAAPEPVLT